MRCANCGRLSPPADAFCANCGTKLDPAQATRAPTLPTTARKTKWAKAFLWIFAAVAAAASVSSLLQLMMLQAPFTTLEVEANDNRESIVGNAYRASFYLHLWWGALIVAALCMAVIERLHDLGVALVIACVVASALLLRRLMSEIAQLQTQNFPRAQ